MGEPPIAWVTGAGRGLGLMIARALYANGWSLGLIGQNPDRLNAAVLQLRELTDIDSTSTDASEAIGGFQRLVTASSVDVSNYEAVRRGVGDLADRLGVPQLLVNNAGVIESDETPIWESDPQEWRRVVEVNLIGVFNVVRATVPLMLAGEPRPLRVINLSTGAATRDAVEYSAYHAAKSGLSRITGALDLAGRDLGLLSFDMAPGVIRTDMTTGMRVHDDRTEWSEPRDLAQLVLEIAHGQWDTWSGRQLRAGTDRVTDLGTSMPDVPSEHARKLRLHPWGTGDPLAP